MDRTGLPPARHRRPSAQLNPALAPVLTDPRTRAVHISVGAALGNLQAAALHVGWEPVVRLLPRPEEPDPLATVRLAGAPRAALLRRPDLYQAIWRRRSSRLPFSAEPVPAAVLAELAEAARLDGADLHRRGPASAAPCSASPHELPACADGRPRTRPLRPADAAAHRLRTGRLSHPRLRAELPEADGQAPAAAELADSARP